MPVNMSTLIRPHQHKSKSAHAVAKERRSKVKWQYVAYAAGGAIAIAACNAVSVIGQYRFAHTALMSFGLPVQILFSVACESVSLFLGATALISDLENSPSTGFKIMSLLSGLGIGLLNYSHDPGTALGITTGVFSLMVPQLWDVLGRKIARPILIRTGAVQPKEHHIKLGRRRWFLNFPRALSITYHDAWSGLSGNPDVKRAISEHNKRRADRTARKAADRAMESLDSELQEIS